MMTPRLQEAQNARTNVDYFGAIRIYQAIVDGVWFFNTEERQTARDALADIKSQPIIGQIPNDQLIMIGQYYKRLVSQCYYFDVSAVAREARFWFEKARDNHQGIAYFYLGDMDEGGFGIDKKDIIAAAINYQKMIDANTHHFLHDQAQNHLTNLFNHMNAKQLNYIGSQYAKGREDPAAMNPYDQRIKRHDPTAHLWLEKAKEKGSAIASRSLGWLYENNFGIEDPHRQIKRYQHAAEYYQYAIDHGYEEAVESLRRLFLSDSLSPRDFYDISLIYHDGIGGVRKNYEKAGVWRKRAQEANEREENPNTLAFFNFSDQDLQNLQQNFTNPAGQNMRFIPPQYLITKINQLTMQTIKNTEFSPEEIDKIERFLNKNDLENLSRKIIYGRCVLIPQKAVLYVWSPNNFSFPSIFCFVFGSLPLDNFRFLRRQFINQEGHVSITLPFHPSFTNDNSKQYDKEFLHISFMGAQDGPFVTRASDVIRYQNAEKFKLRTYELDFSPDELEKAGEEIRERLSFIVQSTRPNPVLEELNIVDLESQIIEDAIATNYRTLFIPQTSNNNFNASSSPVQHCVFQGENCTSVINALLKATGHETYFLSWKAALFFYLLIVFETVLSSYNIGNSIFYFKKHHKNGSVKKTYADEIMSTVALTALVVQIVWLTLSSLSRFTYFYFENVDKKHMHGFLFLAQLILTIATVFVEYRIEQEPFTDKDEHALAIGVYSGLGIGIIHLLTLTFQFEFYTIYRPLTLNRLMQAESIKTPQNRYVEKKEPIKILSTWLSLKHRGYFSSPINHDCFESFGIDRQEFFSRINFEVNSTKNSKIIEILQPAVGFKLVNQGFFNLLRGQNIIERNLNYQDFIDDFDLRNQYSALLPVINSYLHAINNDNWLDPAVLQSISYIYGFNLYFWQVDHTNGDQLVPYNGIYISSEDQRHTKRCDIVFNDPQNNTEFFIVHFRGYEEPPKSGIFPIDTHVDQNNQQIPIFSQNTNRDYYQRIRSVFNLFYRADDHRCLLEDEIKEAEMTENDDLKMVLLSNRGGK